jgi:hypothetical protein
MPSLVTSVINGFQGSSAAHNAAAAQRAGYGQAAGTVNAAVNNANPLISSTAAGAGGNLTTQANQVAGNVGAAGAVAGGGATTAATAANAAGTTAVGNSATLNNPYLNLGNGAAATLASLTAPGADVSTLLPQLDPGYQFRLSQGLQGVDQGAAARGLLGSGATMRAENNYAQGYASNEYANTFNRLAGLAGMGSQTAQYLGTQGLQNAQFQGQLGENAAQYAGNTGLQAAQFGGNAVLNATGQAGQWGVNAANQQASNLINAGVYQGGTQIQQGNATAQGDIGAANAWNSTLGTIGNFGNLAMLAGFPGSGGGWSPSNIGPNLWGGGGGGGAPSAGQIAGLNNQMNSVLYNPYAPYAPAGY